MRVKLYIHQLIQKIKGIKPLNGMTPEQYEVFSRELLKNASVKKEESKTELQIH
jgi:hypothetical protein